jgi:hypothetical protein
MAVVDKFGENSDTADPNQEAQSFDVCKIYQMHTGEEIVWSSHHLKNSEERCKNGEDGI